MCDRLSPSQSRKMSSSSPSSSEPKEEKGGRNPQKIAIIGCGMAGTSAFYQLVTERPVKQIYIFEKSGDFGPGYAWKSTEREEYLVNNTNNTLCLTTDNVTAFHEWLVEVSGDKNAEGLGHASRSRYGDFLKDVLHSTRVMAAVKGIKVTFIPKEVIDIEEEIHPCGQTVATLTYPGTEEEALEKLEVDAVLLTTGRCVFRDRLFDSPSPSLTSSTSPPVYIQEHVDVAPETFDSLPLDATVHIMGASLSCYDVINALFCSKSSTSEFVRCPETGKLKFVPRDNQRRVVICSRSGRLKKIGSKKPMDVEVKHLTLDNVFRMKAMSKSGLTLADLGLLIQQDAKENKVDLNIDQILDPYSGCDSVEEVTARAQEILGQDIDAVKNSTNYLIDYVNKAIISIIVISESALLSPEEEKKYRSEYETLGLSYFAAAPLLTAERLMALFEAGRIEIVKGVKGVTLSEDKTHYRVEHLYGVEEARILVNTAGCVDRNVNSSFQPPLIQNLVKRGLMKSHQRGDLVFDGASIDMKTLLSNGSKTVHVVTMLVWGPTFFSSSAYLMALYISRALKYLYEN